MLNLGKNPAKAEGYSYSTAESRMNKLDLFYRWVWDDEQRFVQTMTTEHADGWMRHLAKQDLKESTKCHYQKAVHTLFKWQCEARNRDIEWEPEISYSDPSTTYQPREYLIESDRRKSDQLSGHQCGLTDLIKVLCWPPTLTESIPRSSATCLAAFHSETLLCDRQGRRLQSDRIISIDTSAGLRSIAFDRKIEGIDSDSEAGSRYRTVVSSERNWSSSFLYSSVGMAPCFIPNTRILGRPIYGFQLD
ncbi:MAG: hypothetical protein ABEI86_02415, partial [Halobacteriaceae archaeon]